MVILQNEGRGWGNVADMMSQEGTDTINLSKGGRLVLRRWAGWRNSYLEEIVLPLLNQGALKSFEPLASSRNAKVWKVSTTETPLVIKSFEARGLRDTIIFRKSRARRAVEGSLMLSDKGFLCPSLVAQGEVTDGLRIMSNFLITEAIESCFTAEEFFALEHSGDSLREKRHLIRAAGKLVGALHSKGIFHGDLRQGNILIKRHGEGYLFYFIDNERNRYFPGGIPDRFRKKNLVQLNMIRMRQVSFTDRLRFFHSYLGENPELDLFAKGWIRDVFLTTKARWEKKVPRDLEMIL